MQTFNILIQTYFSYYIYGALIVGTINAFFFLLNFAEPDQKALDLNEQIWYFTAFVLAYVFWPAKAVQLLGVIISGFREWLAHRTRRYY